MILGLVNRYLKSLKPQAEKRRRPSRVGESGNVFFTLFGAVALVGVVGVATSTLMRGPVGTVVQLNQRAKADAQMQIAQKLAMLEAAQQANSGDCDSDGFVEPLEPKTVGCSSTFPGITGGGCIPDSIGASKTDPWGSDYGYCSWDHGGTIGDVSCPSGNLDGTNDDAEIVIAIVSAGPDRTFNSTCQNHPNYVTKTPGSDDIVLDITYSGAVEASGGLWKLQSGDPTTAEIDKNVFVSGRGDFEAGGRFGAGLDIDSGFLDMTAGSLIMLPDQGSSGACTGGTNDGALRRNNASGNETLEICDPNAPNSGWVDVASAAAGAGAQGPLGAIQLADGGSPNGFAFASALNYTGGQLTTDGFQATANAGVDGTLTVVGNTSLGGTLEVDGTITDGDSEVTVGDDFVVTGTSALAGTTVTTLGATGAVDFDNTLNVDGSSTLAGTTVTTLNATGAVDFDTTLNVDGGTTLQSTLTVNGQIDDADSNVEINDNLDVIGDVFGTSFVNYNAGRNEGLYFDSADGLYLGVGGNPALAVDAGGDVGINLLGSPTAQLDIDGEIRLRSSSVYTSGAACSGPGMIAYNGADELLICSSITGLWETVGTSGGGGGSAGGVWDDEGDYIKYENATYITNAGTALNFSSSLEGAGTRMLWYTSQSAFRVGTVTGTQWNEANTGQYSTAFGLDTIASGDTSFAAGNEALATTDSAMALGSFVEARGTSSVALGNEAIVAAGATNSMAIGLGLPSTATNPQVLSSNSLGIFMGDQQGVNFNTANAMLLAGGKLIIDPDPTSATNIAPSNLLTVDVEGQIGATQYCDEAGINCFLAADVAGGSVTAPGADTEIVFNSGGIMGADPGFVYLRSTGSLGLGVANPAAQIELSEQLLLGNVTDCTAATQGALRLNATDDVLEMCDFNGAGDYIAIGGASSAAPGSDTQIIYNSGGVMYADSGLTYDSAGNLAVDTNALFVNASTNRVGIGTASPGRELTVVSHNDVALRLDTTGNDHSGIEIFQNGTHQWSVYNPNSSNDLRFWAGGTDHVTFKRTTGYVGIGMSGPQTKLDVDGTIKMAFGGEACDASREGAIHFSSGDNNFYVCQSNGSGWQRVITAGSGGGGLPAAGADTQIQFNSGNELAADANFVYNSAGYLGIGSPNPTSRLYIYEDHAADGYKPAMAVDMNTNGSASAYRGIVGIQATALNDALGAGFKEAYGLYAVGRSGNDGAAQTAIGVASRVDVHAGDTGIIYSATDDGSSTGGTQFGLYIDLDDADVTSYGLYQVSNNDNLLSGALGIGTQTPQSQLHLYRSGGTSAVLVEGDEGSTSDLNLLTSGDGASNVGDATATGWSFTARGDTFATASVQNDLMYYYWDGATYQQRFLLENDTGNLVLSDVDVTGDTKLDVDGTIKMAYGNESCDAAREGAIHFNSGDNNFYVCQSAGSWQRVITAGSGGGGLPAAGADTQIQFNSGNELTANANFVYTSAGDFGLGVSSPLARMQVEGGDIIFLSNGGGNVGIGTTTPSTKLHITDVNSLSDGVRLENAAGSHVTSYFEDNSSGAGYIVSYSGTGMQDIILQSSGSVSLANDLSIAGDLDVSGATTLDGLLTTTADSNLGGLIRFSSTGAAVLNVGNTAQRPASPENGMIRYNTDNGRFEAYQAGAWQDILTGSSLASTPERGIQFNSGGFFAASADLVFTSAGNLGLGTATPAKEMHLYDASNPLGATILIEGSGGSLGSYMSFVTDGDGQSNLSETGTKGWVAGGVNETAPSPYDAISNTFGISYVEDGTTYLAAMFTSAGHMKVNHNSFDMPDTALDLFGTLKIDDGGEVCDVDREGAIKYDAGDNNFYFCAESGTGWEPVTLGSGTLAALADTNITTPAEGQFLRYDSASGDWTNVDVTIPDIAASGNNGEIFFRSNNTLDTGANFVYTSAGDFIVGSYQIDDTGNGTEDNRMYFGVSKGAFRAGRATVDVWDYSSAGLYSFAAGSNTVASGDNSTALGNQSAALAQESLATGYQTTASANRSTAMGHQTTASGYSSVAMGSQTTASDFYSTAMGLLTVAGGEASFALGQEAQALGNYSIAFGMGDKTGGNLNPSIVSGVNSFGIFMGAQDNVDLATANTMGLFGGSMVIDPAVPATNLSADTALEIEGTVKIAYGGETCDASREGAIRFDSGANTFSFCADQGNDWETVSLGSGTLAALADTNITTPAEGQFLRYDSASGDWTNVDVTIPDIAASGNNGEIFFRSNNTLDTGANFVYTSAGDFIVGSYQIEDTGTGLEDSRMFFDVSTGAFRAGNVDGNQWNYASAGSYSAAFGSDTLASGTQSFAAGGATQATGGWSTALGRNSTASSNDAFVIGNNAVASGQGSAALMNETDALGIFSFAAGSYSIASGDWSFALGNQVRAGDGSVDTTMPWTPDGTPGEFSMAFGLGSPTGLIPQVSGVSSWGVFMGDQGNVDLTATNTMGLFGGRMVIDPSVPATVLQAETGLDVDAAIRIAFDGEVCSGNAAMEGAIRFDSGANTFSFCADQGNGWESVSLGSGTLAALSDTTISGPADGEVLYYSGGGWVNNTLAINDLSDAQTFYASSSIYLGQGAGGAGTGSGNVALGENSLASLVDGSANVAVGNRAGQNAGTNSYQNVFIGDGAGEDATQGYHNVAIGYFAGGNGLGFGTVAIGNSALSSYTEAWSTSQVNVAVGINALSAVTGGNGNVALGGDAAGDFNTTARQGEMNYNTLLGYRAGRNMDASVTAREFNTIIGALSGTDLIDGNSNLLIGYDIETPGSDTSNYINIGNVFYGSMGTGELYIGGDGALRLPSGADATRPGTLAGTTAINGMIRYNSTSDRFEGYQGGTWQDIVTGSAVGALNDLTDVDTTGLLDNDVLTYNSTSGNWEPAAVSTDFIGLTDTPASYSGQGGRFARVNSGESAIEFTDQIIESVTGEPAPNTIDLNDLGDVSASATDGQALVYDSASSTWVAGTVDSGSLSAAGADTQIQFNSGGAFGADSNFVYTSAGRLGIGTASPEHILDAGDASTMRMWLSTNTNSVIDPYSLGMGGSPNFQRRFTLATEEGTNRFALQFGDGLQDNTVFGLGGSTDVGVSWTPLLAVQGGGNIGFGTSSPRAFVEFASTGAMIIPAGTDAMRPSTGVAGMIRYSSTSDVVEYYDGSSWLSFATSAGSVTTAGAEGDLQFNSGGELGAVSGLNFNVASGTLSVDSIVNIGSTTGAAAPVGAVAAGSGGGVSVFTDLTDTPANYSGAGGQIVAVNSGGTALEFIDAGGAGLWSSGSGDDIYYNSGSYRVGVGTASPAHEVDVTGSVRVSDSVIFQPVSGLSAPSYISSGTLGGLSDVDTTGFADGEVLMYSAGAGNWVPGTVSGGGGGGAINDLSDATTVYSSANMFMGQGAGASNTTSENMTAIGYNALNLATYSNHMTAIGAYAGENFVPASQWSGFVAIGSQAARNVGTVQGIVAVGNEALENFPGNGNTTVGNFAMAASNGGGGDDNIGIGAGVASYMAGSDNVLIGSEAFRGGFGGDYDHGGNSNVIIGRQAAMNVTGATTSNNIILGASTAASLRNGSSNILIGHGLDVSGANAANEMNIGDVIFGSGMYNAGANIGINNSTPNVALDVTGDIEYTGTLTDVSDRRLKTDITPLNADEVIGRLSRIDTYSFRMIDDTKGQLELGVMAQEVEKVFPELVKTANDEMGTKSVNYVGFIAPLIEASKELKSENDMLRAEIADMKLAQAQFEQDIMKEVKGLKAHTGYGINKAQIGLWTIALLFGFSSLFFMVGGILRHRQRNQG